MSLLPNLIVTALLVLAAFGAGHHIGVEDERDRQLLARWDDEDGV